MNKAEQRIRYLADLVRDIDVKIIIESYGFIYCENDKKWKNGEEHNRNFSIDIRDGSQAFKDWVSGNTGGGAIDLIMLIEGCNFVYAVEYLNTNFRKKNVPSLKIKKTNNKVKQKVKKNFIPPIRDDGNWNLVKEWLINNRHLPINKIIELHQSGVLYSDTSENMIFCGKHGAEIVGIQTKKKYKSLASGTNKDYGIWISKPTLNITNKIIIVESCIDGISAEFIMNDIVAVSTSGLAKPKKLVNLKQWCDKNSIELICGYDNDTAGIKSGLELTSKLGIKHLKPTLKDWNDDLIQAL